MAALEAEADRLIALGAVRVRRHEPTPPMETGLLGMADRERNEAPRIRAGRRGSALTAVLTLARQPDDERHHHEEGDDEFHTAGEAHACRVATGAFSRV